MLSSNLAPFSRQKVGCVPPKNTWKKSRWKLSIFAESSGNFRHHDTRGEQKTFLEATPQIKIQREMGNPSSLGWRLSGYQSFCHWNLWHDARGDLIEVLLLLKWLFTRKKSGTKWNRSGTGVEPSGFERGEAQKVGKTSQGSQRRERKNCWS